MFLYCFDELNRNKLITNGYRLVKEGVLGGKKAYLFYNNGKTMAFSKSEVIFTDKLYF